MSDVAGTRAVSTPAVHPHARSVTTRYLVGAVLLVIAAISVLAEHGSAVVAVAFAVAGGVGLALARWAWRGRS